MPYQTRRRSFPAGILAALTGTLLVSLGAALSGVEAIPSSVTVAGSFQSEAGCPGDWQPECAATHLAHDAADDVWQGVWTLPAGSYEYKAALNDSWAENYGRHAVLNGPNIPLSVAASTPVKFYYDDKTHWITDGVSSVVATVPGSFQSELGCPGDWAPDCLRSWLQDVDGDGIYVFSTQALPAGSYEAKVTLSESWTVNYGAGGVQNGPNIPFTVPANDTTMSFTYDAITHILVVSAGQPGAPVPEPVSLLLLAPGLAALGAAAWRRPPLRGHRV